MPIKVLDIDLFMRSWKIWRHYRLSLIMMNKTISPKWVMVSWQVWDNSLDKASITADSIQTMKQWKTSRRRGLYKGLNAWSYSRGNMSHDNDLISMINYDECFGVTFSMKILRNPVLRISQQLLRGFVTFKLYMLICHDNMEEMSWRWYSYRIRSGLKDAAGSVSRSFRSWIAVG